MIFPKLLSLQLGRLIIQNDFSTDFFMDKYAVLHCLSAMV